MWQLLRHVSSLFTPQSLPFYLELRVLDDWFLLTWESKRDRPHQQAKNRSPDAVEAKFNDSQQHVCLAHVSPVSSKLGNMFQLSCSLRSKALKPVNPPV